MINRSRFEIKIIDQSINTLIVPALVCKHVSVYNDHSIGTWNSQGKTTSFLKDETLLKGNIVERPCFNSIIMHYL